MALAMAEAAMVLAMLWAMPGYSCKPDKMALLAGTSWHIPHEDYAGSPSGDTCHQMPLVPSKCNIFQLCKLSPPFHDKALSNRPPPSQYLLAGKLRCARVV